VDSEIDSGALLEGDDLLSEDSVWFPPKRGGIN
jgi:hypothetical protein